MINHEVRDVLVAQLQARLRSEKRLSNPTIESYARVLGCSTRHLRRLVSGSARRNEADWVYSIDAAAFEAYILNAGNAKKTHGRLAALGVAVPNLRTFQRAIRRDLSAGERAFARRGEAARRENSVYVSWEAPHRNAVWMCDGKELDVLVVPERGTTPIRVNLFSFHDAYSRGCMGFVVTPTPTAQDVVAALRSAVTLTQLSFGPFHGVCDELILDNALAHFAHDVLANAMALGVGQSPIPPYSPYLIGKIERFHRTLRDEWAADCPFYTHAPEQANGQPFHPKGKGIPLRALVEKLSEFIRTTTASAPIARSGGGLPNRRGSMTPRRFGRRILGWCDSWTCRSRPASSAGKASSSRAVTTWRLPSTVSTETKSSFGTCRTTRP
jgi:putative transposase